MPENRYSADWIVSLPLEQRREVVLSLDLEAAKKILSDWRFWARPEQLAPPGDWTYWLACAGRGWGKTRAGAEWVNAQANAMPGSRGFLAARTAGDLRDVVIEGESGIMSLHHERDCRPMYEPSRRRVVWPNGSQAITFSADAPESGRGPQSHWGWADELAAWSGWDLWTQLLLGLRLGSKPRAMVTTTPRPLRVIRDLIADPNCVVTKGSTYDNAANLAPAFFEHVIKRYEGTRLGRQELLAEMLDDVPGALWTRKMVDDLRVSAAPSLQRIVVAVDPAVTSGDNSDLTGIVVAGLGSDGHGYVLEDLTCKMTPDGWARRAVGAFHSWKADRMIAEVNQGGDLVERIVRTVDPNVSYKSVHASRGKRVRAEPVSALYEQGKVHHVGAGLTDLEDQMCQFTPTGFDGSPDRVDALVYALTELDIFGSAVFAILT